MGQDSKGKANAGTVNAKASSRDLPEGNVDQIREILFGGQMRDYDRRFQELDERVQRDLDRFRQDQHKRLEALEQLLRDETTTLAAAIKRLEGDQRKQQLSLTDQLQSTEGRLQDELAELANQLEESSRQLRDRLLKLGQETADGMQQQADDFSRNLGSATHELRDAKVAREELAGFFSEMALRLKRDFELPGE
jgi:DNA anti-recombination protein RmuC